MSDVLARICADKRDHITNRKKACSIETLRETALTAPSPRSFAERLENASGGDNFALIAEIKRASPSRGLIRQDFDPESLAEAYEKGGAACLSVLTDAPYFQGEDRFLSEARNAVSLPVLRKDFILDPYQITESRALGADCILLIMAALGDAQALDLEAMAQDFGLDVLVEVHDEAELERALALKTRLIGINNRNLKSLDVDLATTERLAPKIPKGYTIVCESGIYKTSDLHRMAGVDVRCFLVGESLMRQNDVEEATRALLSGE
jgi:indole-3-glycerol phosphate synthase